MMQFFRKHVRAIMLVIVVLFVVSIFSMYGIRGGSRVPEGGGDRTVAKVDGKSVKMSTIETEMAKMIKNMGLENTVTSRDYPMLRRNILDQLAIKAELDKEIKNRNVSVEKSEIEESLKKIVASFPTAEIYQEQLKRVGVTEAQLKKDIEEQMKVQKLIEQVTADVSTDQKEMRSFYDTMKAYAFQKPDGFKVNLAHFKVKAAAEKFAKLLEEGAKWDGAIVEVGSADIIDHTPYDKPSLVPLVNLTGNVEFLKDLPMNKVSRAVKLADDNFVVAIKRSAEKAGTASYNEVSADIEQMILGQKRQTKQGEFLQALKEKARIDIVDEDYFKVPEPKSPDVKGEPDEKKSDATTDEKAEGPEEVSKDRR